MCVVHVHPRSYALQHLPSLVQPGLRKPAEGLRVVLLPAAQLHALPDLAWSLHAHARCRFVVVASGLEGAPHRAEVAAMLSGVGGFFWPRNAMVLAAFSESGIPPELSPLFQEGHRATVESLDYCA